MTSAVVARAWVPGFPLRAFANEVGKELRLVWRRRSMMIAAGVGTGFMYLMIQFFVGGGHLELPVLAVTLPALPAELVAAIAAVQGSGGIAEEINGGTLEQSQFSPAPPMLLAAGRLTAVAVEGMIPAAVLVLAFGLGYRPHWVIRPDALVPLALTVADALGYGLLMTALTLRMASIGAVVHIFNMAIMLFGGMFVPVTAFPHGVEAFARFIPTTLGVQVLNTALAGRGLGAAWSDGTLPWLIVHATAIITLAWVTYLGTLRRAQREGGLSPR